MKNLFSKLGLLLLAILLNNNVIKAQLVSTFAGNLTAGTANGVGTAAQFSSPFGIARDASGNFFVADRLNHLIRKITPTGLVSTYAGTGTAGFVNGAAASAKFYRPSGVAVDNAGNVFVADEANNVIRKISTTGVVSTFAGSGAFGTAAGLGTAATFGLPTGITTDASGNVYVADHQTCMIRKITPAGLVSNYAGTGSYGYADGITSTAQFNNPYGLAVDVSGNLFVADQGNRRIRKITPAGIVSTFAGSGVYGNNDGIGIAAGFSHPTGLTFDLTGNLFVADYDNHSIRKITPSAVVSFYAGNQMAVGTYPTNVGYVDGLGAAASFHFLPSITNDLAGNLYVVDESNNMIRKIVPYSSTPCTLTVTTSGEGCGTTACPYIATGTPSGGTFSAPLNATTGVYIGAIPLGGIPYTYTYNSGGCTYVANGTILKPTAASIVAPTLSTYVGPSATGAQLVVTFPCTNKCGEYYEFQILQAGLPVVGCTTTYTATGPSNSFPFPYTPLPASTCGKILSCSGLVLGQSYQVRMRINRCGIYGNWSSYFSTPAQRLGNTHIVNETTNDAIKIYPNPITETMNISMTSEANQQLYIHIVDISGRLVKKVEQRIEQGENNLSIDMSALSKGVYMVQLLNQNKLKQVTKITKE